MYTALFPPLEETDENRVLTTYTTKSVGGRYGSLIDKPWVKSLLFTWVLFGTCLTISDGLLTPVRPTRGNEDLQNETDERWDDRPSL